MQLEISCLNLTESENPTELDGEDMLMVFLHKLIEMQVDYAEKAFSSSEQAQKSDVQMSLHSYAVFMMA